MASVTDELVSLIMPCANLGKTSRSLHIGRGKVGRELGGFCRSLLQHDWKIRSLELIILQNRL